MVLNYSPLSDSIPQETKDRIFEAARYLNYRPNYIARSLRNQRTHTIGVLIPEMSEGYSAAVLSGVEEKLLQEGYFYFVASHHHREDMIEQNTHFLVERDASKEFWRSIRRSIIKVFCRSFRFRDTIASRA